MLSFVSSFKYLGVLIEVEMEMEGARQWSLTKIRTSPVSLQSNLSYAGSETFQIIF